MRELRCIDAVREAMAEEMRRDESIFVLGEGIGPRGGNFTETAGFYDEFGAKRLIDTPISELGFTGLAIGAAATGLHPIVDLMFWDFGYEASGQLINQAARLHWMSNGQVKVPLVVRAVVGIGPGNGPHHSASPYPIYAHMPGLKIVVPSVPYDFKGLLKTALRDKNPVLVFENMYIYNLRGPVPEEEYTVPFGQARVHREGKDVTIVALSRMVHVSMQAAEELEKEGISVEIVDPRTLVPLDKGTILSSVRKTGRLVVVDEAYAPFGVGAEMAALVADEAFYYLDAPVKRVHPLSVPAPYAPLLAEAVLPSAEKVIAAVKDVLKE